MERSGGRRKIEDELQMQCGGAGRGARTRARNSNLPFEAISLINAAYDCAVPRRATSSNCICSGNSFRRPLPRSRPRSRRRVSDSKQHKLRRIIQLGAQFRLTSRRSAAPADPVPLRFVSYSESISAFGIRNSLQKVGRWSEESESVRQRCDARQRKEQRPGMRSIWIRIRVRIRMPWELGGEEYGWRERKRIAAS